MAVAEGVAGGDHVPAPAAGDLPPADAVKSYRPIRRITAVPIAAL
ncbi:MAG: hypothetical protein ACRDTG_21560 [Pseudonocardiaceae bacterium]